MHPYEFLQRYGPCALVTDAASELGAAFAALLAKGGFDLLLTTTEPGLLQALAARLRDHEGVNVSIVTASLDLEEYIPALLDSCQQLDTGLLLDASAGAQLSRAMMPQLVARDRGGCIFTQSILGDDTLLADAKTAGIDIVALADSAADSNNQKVSAREIAQQAIDTICEHP
ncbi:MAG: hypothetical protein ABJ308_15120 [Halieaceae bacterium]